MLTGLRTSRPATACATASTSRRTQTTTCGRRSAWRQSTGRRSALAPPNTGTALPDRSAFASPRGNGNRRWSDAAGGPARQPSRSCRNPRLVNDRVRVTVAHPNAGSQCGAPSRVESPGDRRSSIETGCQRCGSRRGRVCGPSPPSTRGATRPQSVATSRSSAADTWASRLVPA